MTQALKKFLEMLHEKNPALYQRLDRLGGLRGLFDPRCHEFKHSTLDEKVAVVRELSAYAPLEQLKCLFFDAMLQHRYGSVAANNCWGDAMQAYVGWVLAKLPNMGVPS